MSDEHAFTARLNAVAAEVEAMLEALLSPALSPGEQARPQRLLDAMRYAALDGGKRLRPFLVVESAALFGASGSGLQGSGLQGSGLQGSGLQGSGLQGSGLLRAACALELVHCYSLVHDDLPAMDDDDLRRGKPTVHRAFDEATAILAGDGLLTYAFDVMTDPATHPDAAVRCELALGLARASGLGGMAGGQMLDLAAEAAGIALSRAEIEQLQAMKTGALLRFGAEAGAIFASADAKERAALVAYGQALGAAFQIADDILDADGNEAAMGKRVAKDAGRNKGTLVAVLGMEAARKLRDVLAQQAVDALAPFGARADVLAQAALFTARRAH